MYLSSKTQPNSNLSSLNAAIQNNFSYSFLRKCLAGIVKGGQTHCHTRFSAWENVISFPRALKGRERCLTQSLHISNSCRKNVALVSQLKSLVEKIISKLRSCMFYTCIHKCHVLDNYKHMWRQYRKIFLLCFRDLGHQKYNENFKIISHVFFLHCCTIRI